MTSKLIVAFRHDHEASPPSCSTLSSALDRKLRGRHQRCHSLLFGQGFNSQVLSFSQWECQRNRPMIDPVLEVANAAA
jgi:hypothetical protein